MTDDEQPAGASASNPRNEDELIEAALQQELGPRGATGAVPPVPEQIGPYRIIREIGAGGMGVVYEAEQAEPTRRVALKVVRTPAGVGTYHLRLFQREIQVLGRFRHPSIAQIYEAGHTEDGQQYFVMELIEGEPLIEYCELADLSLQARLALFARVCDAVQYAHQRGVIHRDLKPANILVDDDGVPHVLDFGLAKFIDPEMEVTRSLLEGQALVGTLPYMSPEQTALDSIDLDVRTDVYSLGVMLYEMLTGKYPYEVIGQLADVLRNIVEAEPAKPSSIHRKINDEVETIVLRALAKKRERRYQSAEALGKDVQRYLAGDPIEAKRDSVIYVIRKLAVRHAYATAVIIALWVMTAGFGLIYFDLYRQTQRAKQAEQVSDARAAQNNEQLVSLAGDVPPVVREMALGWFLLEWHADRLDRARQIRDRAIVGSSVRAAMDFLLEKSYTFEKLLGELPQESVSLAYLVVGERHLKAGELDEARRAFGESLAYPGSEWLASSAQARLSQLVQEIERKPIPDKKEE